MRYWNIQKVVLSVNDGNKEKFLRKKETVTMEYSKNNIFM